MCYLTGVSEGQEARSSLAEKASQSQLGMQRSEGCQYRRIHFQEDLLTRLLAITRKPTSKLARVDPCIVLPQEGSCLPPKQATQDRAREKTLTTLLTRYTLPQNKRF